ncbi:MAG: Oligopeptide transport system permease protein OppB [Chlamydiae bacterium]|nr:Oligopeptide transport system permease protein OppB [Chlamydiota bacterium]
MVTLTFMMMKALPGDPFSEEKALPTEVMTSLKHHYGLDTSLFHQYLQYLFSIMTFNFGPSIVYPNKTVVGIIKSSFPVSAVIGTQALFIALFLGVIFGTLSAIFHPRWQQKTLMLFGVCLISIPSFLLATLLQYALGIYFDFLPMAKWGTWEHTILPTISLAVFPTALIARLVRTNLLEVMKLDYIKNAKAKGLSSFEILWFHALPNSLIPVIGYMGQLMTSILVGSFIVEKIFGIPGLGQWFIASIMNRDYPVIMGTTVFYSFLLILFIFCSDCLYLVVDPRIQLRSHPRNV